LHAVVMCTELILGCIFVSIGVACSGNVH